MYDGEWCRNKLQGEGEYFSRDGRSYAGEWDEGKRHGRGMELQKNGEKYDYGGGGMIHETFTTETLRQRETFTLKHITPRRTKHETFKLKHEHSILTRETLTYI